MENELREGFRTGKYTCDAPNSKSNSKKEKMMTLYQIYSAVDNEDAYADLKQDGRKIVEFINYNKGNYTDEAVFIAQSGYTSKNISKTDYIQTIPKMLLLSETFINKLADKLKNELDFFQLNLGSRMMNLNFSLEKLN